MSITKAADSGDRMETLEALRHKLAVAIDQSDSGRDIAALSKQLREVLEEIELAQPEEPKTRTVREIVRQRHGA